MVRYYLYWILLRREASSSFFGLAGAFRIGSFEATI